MRTAIKTIWLALVNGAMFWASTTSMTIMVVCLLIGGRP
jgi:hypothetical protein